MPIPSDYRDIVKTLLERTEMAEVNWQTTKFGVEVPIDGSKFNLWAGTDENTEEPFVSFGLADAHGNPLDTWFVDAGDTDYELVDRLFQAAKRHALGVPQRLKQLREILKKSSVIGAPKG